MNRYLIEVCDPIQKKLKIRAYLESKDAFGKCFHSNKYPLLNIHLEGENSYSLKKDMLLFKKTTSLSISYEVDLSRPCFKSFINLNASLICLDEVLFYISGISEVEIRFPSLWSKILTSLKDISKKREIFKYSCNKLNEHYFLLGCHQSNGMKIDKTIIEVAQNSDEKLLIPTKLKECFQRFPCSHEKVSFYRGNRVRRGLYKTSFTKEKKFYGSSWYYSLYEYSFVHGQKTKNLSLKARFFWAYYFSIELKIENFINMYNDHLKDSSSHYTTLDESLFWFQKGQLVAKADIWSILYYWIHYLKMGKENFFKNFPDTNDCEETEKFILGTENCDLSELLPGKEILYAEPAWTYGLKVKKGKIVSLDLSSSHFNYLQIGDKITNYESLEDSSKKLADVDLEIEREGDKFIYRCLPYQYPRLIKEIKDI